MVASNLADSSLLVVVAEEDRVQLVLVRETLNLMSVIMPRLVFSFLVGSSWRFGWSYVSAVILRRPWSLFSPNE